VGEESTTEEDAGVGDTVGDGFADGLDAGAADAGSGLSEALADATEALATVGDPLGRDR